MGLYILYIKILSRYKSENADYLFLTFYTAGRRMQMQLRNMIF